MSSKTKFAVYNPTNPPNPMLIQQGKAYGDLLEFLKKKVAFCIYFFGVGGYVLFAISLLLFYQANSMQTTVPVLVNVMPTGEAAFLGEVRQTGEMIVPESAILFQVRRFVTNMRSIPADAQVLYNNINECYSKVTSSYEPHMTRHLRANSPFPLVGKIRRTIEIESALRITGSSYQVDWTEISVEPGGSPVRRRVRGLVTVTLIPPHPSFIRDNPLGIFIDDFEWTEL